jgi:thiol:disulfide interchange protein DsbC
MKRILPLYLICIFPVSVSVAVSAEPDLNQIRAELARSFPEAKSATLRVSPVAGVYEVDLNGQIVYLSADGKFLILGDILEVKTRTNITEGLREKTVVKQLEAIGEKDMIVMGPANAKRTITVFTDVDCPYCVRLHQDVPELNKYGVKVRYLLYPRSGIGGETYQRSVSIWCADDRVKAVGIAKAGGQIAKKTCNNPVERHFQLGNRLDVSGTPTIFLDNGKRIGGYVPAAMMLALLGLKGPESAKAQ